MWQRISLVLALVLAARPADACGPDFPVSLLVHRADSLETLWDGSFLDEAGLLITAPADVLPPAIPKGDEPSAIELAIYDRGAHAFHAGEVARANRAFTELLALPAAQRRHRSTWAAFMLHDHAQVRRLIAAGFYDERNLAAFELGELAKVELAHGRIEAAVRLYAEQAAAGDLSGAVSLLFVVRKVVDDWAATRRLVRDDVGLRLLEAYYYTRHNELVDASGKRLWTGLRAQAKRGIGLHLLAAAAYRDGNFADAAAFAARAPDELIAKWVRAKLALRDGDTATARRYLGEVETARPTRCTADEDRTDPLVLARADLGLVALADQRFGDALAWFRAGHQFVEASYLAERVLSLDELHDLVGAAPPTPYTTCAWLDEPDTSGCWGGDLASLYARRLMRAGRFHDALPYFDPVLRDDATHYADTLAAAAGASDPIDRAEQLFAASQRARHQGLALMGTEHAPDWAMYDGDYARATLCRPDEAASHDGDDDEGEGCVAPKPADRKFISAGELARVAASAPDDDVRFHYRALASHLAEAAADLVPPRSQAFAALLCQAATYVEYREPARVKALYQRYVKEGPAGFGRDFGDQCPTPDFAHARTFAQDHAPAHRSFVTRLYGFAGRHLWGLLGIGAVALLALAGLLVRRRGPLLHV